MTDETLATSLRILRYIVAGGFVTAFNLIILFVGVHYIHLWYITAAVIAFSCAVTVSYLLQKFWTFKNYDTNHVGAQFISFVLFALVTLGLNTMLIYFFVDTVGLWYIFAQICASLITASINYICFKKFVFNPYTSSQA